MTIDELYKIIKNRKEKMPENSYTASLFIKGEERIIQKVGEEAIEVILATKNESKQRLVEEISDLWFHTLILMCSFKIEPKDVFYELDKRNIKKK